MLFARLATKAELEGLIGFTAERSVGDDNVPRIGRGVLALAIRAGYRHSARGLRKPLASNNLRFQFLEAKCWAFCLVVI